VIATENEFAVGHFVTAAKVGTVRKNLKNAFKIGCYTKINPWPLNLAIR